MALTDPKKTVLTLLAMAEGEATVARFYEACAARWPAEAAFWNSIAAQEFVHRDNIKRMSEIVAEKPELFVQARPFTVEGVDKFIKLVEMRAEQVKAPETPALKALYFSREIEDSLLEAKYGEFLQTLEPEYSSLVKTVLSDTASHKRMLAEKIIFAERTR